MAKYVCAIDQGTTSTRFMIFDHAGNVVGYDQKEHEQIYPKPGWVEHDATEIWQRAQEVIDGALKKTGIDPKDIAAVGITNQRETTVVWDQRNRQTGLQRHCVAGYPHRYHLQRTCQRWRPGSLPRESWPASGDLFLRPQGEMDSG